MNLLLLPGMDGTGELFAPLLPHLSGHRCTVARYATDTPQSYDALLQTIALPEGRFAIIAESFSGPLGIRLAAKHPDRVCALVLAATFLRSPSPLARLPKLLTWPLFAMPLPKAMARLALLGQTAPAELLHQLTATLATIAPDVLAERLREIARVDVRKEFSELRLPLLQLVATRDRLLNRTYQDEFAALNPGLLVQHIAAPHLLLQRAPATAAEVILGFLHALNDADCTA